MYNDYSTWDTYEYSLSSLYLDDKNPRIKYRGNDKLNQKQIIDFLIENEKVYELAKKISEEGYFPNENPIICIENDKKVVLEGNRRTAALKILQNPNKYLSKPRANILLQNIARNNFSRDKIRCIIAPNRLLASPIIYERHNGTSLQRWKTGNQYLFVAEMYYEDALSIEEICEVLNETKSKVLKPLKAYNLFLEGKEILEKENIILDIGSFDFTNLERFYAYDEARILLGIDFNDENGELIINLPQQEFEKRVLEIFKILIDAERFSRDFNREEDKKNFIENLKKNPNFDFSVSNTESQTKSKSSEQRESLEDKKKNTTTRKKRRRTVTIENCIIPRNKEIIFENDKLDTLFQELKSLPIDKVYSFAILLRSYLEQSLYFYLTQNNLMDDLSEKLNARNKKHNEKKVETLISSLKGRYKISEDIATEPIMEILKLNKDKDYSNVGLKDMLDYVNDQMLGSYLNLDTKELQVVKEEIELIKKGMDLVVHNIKYPLSSIHNGISWKKLEPLLEALSNNINTENK